MKTKEIKIKVYKDTKETKEGRKFDVYSTKVNLKDGSTKWINVKFTKKAVEQYTASGAKPLFSEWKGGSVIVNNIYIPESFESVTKEDGSKEYPVIWIRGFTSLEDYTSNSKDLSNIFIDSELNDIK